VNTCNIFNFIKQKYVNHFDEQCHYYMPLSVPWLVVFKYYYGSKQCGAIGKHYNSVLEKHYKKYYNQKLVLKNF